MKTKHTPGPWTTDGNYVVPCEDFSKAQPGTLFVALCGISSSYRTAEETKANATLIASAPELLDACQEAQKLIELARPYFPKSMHDSDKFALENANAMIGRAIAKATS